ncbi:LysR family transcriptional regulator [Methylosinus sp. RM1]|uniref:LysR family transcriptional regulator n=1 Tax=Methylosinus sp. RM1 TaxID=2583817 RepID=UPI00140C072C|nr:LysR family transcriptional regulator [Methylosinus sp. RM1]
MEPFVPEQRGLHRSVLDEDTLRSGQYWGELRVFLAVAKAKSFNRAAEILGMSQPTVSRRVKRLQDLMGAQLVIVTQQGIMLTEKGQALAFAVSRLDEQVFLLMNGIRSRNGDVEGVVRVSVTDALAALFVAPALRLFSQDYARIQVHLKTPLNISDLHENQTDMMIGFRPAESRDLIFQPLGHLHFIPVAAQSYVREFGTPTRQNLEDHRFIQSEFYTARTGLWDEWIRACERGRIAHYCDHPFTYAMLVKSGMGIGLLASYTVLDKTAVPLDLSVHVAVPMLLIAVSERLQSRPARLVFDWLAASFGKDNPWFRDELAFPVEESPFDEGFRQLFNLGD